MTGPFSWVVGSRLGRVFFVVLFVVDNVGPVCCLVHSAGVVSGFLHLPWRPPGPYYVSVVGFGQIPGSGFLRGSIPVVVYLLLAIVVATGGGIGGFLGISCYLSGLGTIVHCHGLR